MCVEIDTSKPTEDKPMNLDVYVVTSQTAKRFNIKSGSAIVALKNQDGENRKVFFEGNVYGSEDLESFESKLLHAAGRAVMNYPTIAKAFIPLSQLHCVGEYDYERKCFVGSAENDGALQNWLSNSGK